MSILSSKILICVIICIHAVFAQSQMKSIKTQDEKTGAILELTYYTDLDDNGNALLRGKWDYYGNDTWTWTPTRHYRICMQISKDINGTREKIRWENEEGKWMPVVVVEVKDKPIPAPKIDPKTNKTIPPEECVDTPPPTNPDPAPAPSGNSTDDKNKTKTIAPSQKVCPGKGGNHTDHAQFCALADDSKLLTNQSGVTVVEGSGQFDSFNQFASVQFTRPFKQDITDLMTLDDGTYNVWLTYGNWDHGANEWTGYVQGDYYATSFQTMELLPQKEELEMIYGSTGSGAMYIKISVMMTSIFLSIAVLV